MVSVAVMYVRFQYLFKKKNTLLCLCIILLCCFFPFCFSWFSLDNHQVLIILCSSLLCEKVPCFHLLVTLLFSLRFLFSFVFIYLFCTAFLIALWIFRFLLFCSIQLSLVLYFLPFYLFWGNHFLFIYWIFWVHTISLCFLSGCLVLIVSIWWLHFACAQVWWLQREERTIWKFMPVDKWHNGIGSRFICNKPKLCPLFVYLGTC